MKFLEETGVRIRNIRLDFRTDLDPDLDPGLIFHFSVIERWVFWALNRTNEKVADELYDIFGQVGLRIANGVGGGLNSVSALLFQLLFFFRCPTGRLCEPDLRLAPCLFHALAATTRYRLTPSSNKQADTLTGCQR